MYSEYFDKMRKKYDSYRKKDTEWREKLNKVLNEKFDKETGLVRADGCARRLAIDTWMENNPEPKSPYYSGEILAMEAYEWSADIGADTVILDEDVGSHFVPKFVGALRKAGFDSFVLTHSDVNTLDRLDDFVLEGCKLGELVQILTAKNEPGKRSFARTGIEIIL